MRIIGGQFKGRRFNPPAKNWPTRPTTDFAKEGLFNILQNSLDFEKVKMLDLFGGTGSHCYEFISRGCRSTTYVDKFPGCVAFAKRRRQNWILRIICASCGPMSLRSSLKRGNSSTTSLPGLPTR